MNIKQTLLENSNEIRRLYVEEGLTAREIGKIYGCSKHPILDALKELCITRHARHKGPIPTCEQLEKWVTVDHLTLIEMGKIVDAHPTGIRWWINKCGIQWDPGLWSQRNQKREIVEPSKSALESWYYDDGLTLDEIADKIGVSRQYVYSRFNEYGITTRPDGWLHKRFDCEDGHIVKSSYELRVDNWLFDHGIAHIYEFPLTPLGGSGSADFKIGNIFVEVWGVTHSESYGERRKIKMSWYANKEYQLISINYWDFSAQRKGLWERKLMALLP